MNPAEITAYFHEHIPITRAMGVKVEVSDASGLILSAPLAPNHNHLGTAFGGSLSAIATLAGYGLIWLALEDREAHVVVKDGAFRFRRPVRGEIRAICRPPDLDTMQAFRGEFAQKGRARLHLRAAIETAGELAVEFEGTFVASR